MNILILTGKFGMGHYAASNALGRNIKNSIPEANISVVDLLEYTMPEYAPLIYKSFEILVSKVSSVYNMFYKLGEKGGTEQSLFLSEYFLPKIQSMLEEYQPHIIISTLPLSSQLVSIYKENTGSAVPLVTCITDVSTHPEWLNPHTNYYLVASPTVRNTLISLGVAPNKVLVYGIPVNPNFAANQLYCCSTARHLLIMGGGLGLLPKDTSFYEELNNIPGVKTTILTGNNQKLYHKLYGYYKNIQVVGYTNQVDSYMRGADLILSKPGGITLFEAIYSQLPFLCFPPFLQQEIHNSQFIQIQGIGRVLQKNQNIISEIQRLICDEPTLNLMRENMSLLRSSLDCDALSTVLHQLMAPALCA